MKKSAALPTQIQLQFPVEGIVEELSALREELAELRRFIHPFKKWYDLTEVAELKGVPYGTITGRAWLKPNAGIPDGVIGGRSKWRHETVMKWIDQTDENLPEPSPV